MINMECTLTWKTRKLKILFFALKKAEDLNKQLNITSAVKCEDNSFPTFEFNAMQQ